MRPTFDDEIIKMDLENNNWKRACSHADLLRIYAGLTILLGIVLGVLWFQNKSAYQQGGHDLSPIIYPAVFFIVLGIGLLLNLRIVSVIHSITFGSLGCWLIIGSILHLRETLWVLLNLPFGLLLLLPAFSTIMAWRALR